MKSPPVREELVKRWGPQTKTQGGGNGEGAPLPPTLLSLARDPSLQNPRGARAQPPKGLRASYPFLPACRPETPRSFWDINPTVAFPSADPSVDFLRLSAEPSHVWSLSWGP